MDSHTIRTLEYDKVLRVVSRYASSDAGKQAVINLEPLDTMDEARGRLRLASEMKSLLEWGASPPLGAVPDTRDAAERARTPGAVLDAKTLLAVAQSTRAGREMKRFLAGNVERAPLLAKIGSGLADLGDIEKAIDGAIDEDTNVKDGASPHLRKIRQEKNRVTARISSALQTFLAKENLRQHLQDCLITIRSGRYVVPVRADAKGKLSGIVHDTSQSGATVFIEPMETVELNNTLRSLELEEKDEIQKILADLTRRVGANADAIVCNLGIVFRLDAITAAARFSMEFDCTEPELAANGRIVIRGGRHPLLVETCRTKGGGNIVPLDISIGDGKRGLIITGPNAGGKTVALKTIGVLALLARAGLHVPCGDGTEIGLFGRIFVDIGDEQSIELSLSTFSSHMKNIVKVLAEADRDSLVLLDELGAGTDPAEGTALARAVIEDLLASGATIVATTHHMDLKVLAHENPLLENASMEFDSRDLVPTYRLVQGIPGASHAFEIASRLGLAEGTLARARHYWGGERVKLEDLSRDLLEKIRKIEQEEETVEAKRKRADQVLAEYEAGLKEFREREKDLRKQALKDARSIVEDAKRTAERLVGELKELKAKRAEPVAARAVEKQIKEEARGLVEAIRELECTRELRPLAEVVAGSRAFVKPLSAEGVIVSGPDAKGRVEVAVGAVRAEVHVGDLFEPEREPARAAGGVVSFEAKVVPPEIDVRGMTAEDAWEIVDKYVDDASLSGLPFVRVIHGKGKGILANRIREMLAAHPRVKSHRFGERDEGGTGVTVIVLE